MRVLHFFEHVKELVDSMLILFCAFGYPVVGPGEEGNTTFDTFFSGWPMAIDDFIGPGSGVAPEDVGESEDTEKHDGNKQYD
ncbi:hypothetical protein ES703_29043 [subsurface metagenome]